MTSELGSLYVDVKAGLAIRSPGTSVVFGRKEPAKQNNQGTNGGNRVVFHHGAPNGDAGDELAPRYPGQVVRALKDELETFTVYVWGYDQSDANSEIKQHDAAWNLFRAWRREVFIAAEGRVVVGAKSWESPDRRERPYGAELVIECSIRSPVYDVTDAIAATGPLHSTTTVTEQGESEIITT